MLQIVSPTSFEHTVERVVVMRCGNCHRLTRTGFVVLARSARATQRAIDETAMEIWGDFVCEACDYDKACVLAISIEPSGRD